MNEFNPRRPLHVDDADQLTEVFARLLGEAIMNWNSIQVVVYLIFCGFSEKERVVAAHEFQKPRSDARARQMMLALACENLRRHADPKAALLRERLQAFVKKLNDLQDWRNKVVHSPVWTDRSGAVLISAYDPRKAWNERYDSHDRLVRDNGTLQCELHDIVKVFNDLFEFINWPDQLLNPIL